MTVQDEEFYAWLDGELPEDRAELVAAQVAAQPELAERARQHRALKAKLQAAFGPIAGAPIPDRLAAGLQTSAQVLPFRGRRDPAPRVRGGWQWPQMTALAASLAIGIATGSLLQGGRGGLVEAGEGQVIASGKLQAALDTQLASADQAGAPVRIGLTFRDDKGAICRSFEAKASRGLACRSGEDWQVRGLFAGQDGAGDYRMAGAGDPALAELIDSSLAGEAFDAKAEQAAMKAGWR